MALDTANKRGSSIGGGLDFLAVLPAPDVGAETASDRAQTAALYAMGADAPAEVTAITFSVIPILVRGRARRIAGQRAVAPRVVVRGR